MDGDSLASRVRSARKKKGLTQSALARTVGVQTLAISDIERGVTLSPRGETLRAIAEALDVTVDWLLRGDAPEPPPESHVEYEPGHRLFVPPLVKEFLETERGRALPPEIQEAVKDVAGRLGPPKSLYDLELMVTVIERGFEQRAKEGPPKEEDLQGFLPAPPEPNKKGRR